MAGAGVAVALIDGEHYPPVVRDALELVAQRYQMARRSSSAAPRSSSRSRRRRPTGCPSWSSASRILRLPSAGCSRAAASTSSSTCPTSRSSGSPTGSSWPRSPTPPGAAYEAGGLTLAAPVRGPYPRPSIAIIGTGKRIGKTAVSAHLARLAARRLGRSGRVVVVAMGRGGPREPELVDPSVDGGPDVRALLARARRAEHAASDFLEDATLAGVATVGARRCGAGPAGDVVTSTVPEAALLAARLDPALTVFEGSGAAIPPIACTRTLLVCPARIPPEELTASLGAVRPLLADAVVITGADAAPREAELLGHALRVLEPGLPVVACRLAPTPAGSVRGRRVACFTTAPAAALAAIRAELERSHGADVAFLSGDLARRDLLREQLAAGALGGVDLALVEIKAAAIDVVAEAADAAGLPIVFLDNRPEPADGGDALDRLLASLVDEAVGASARAEGEAAPGGAGSGGPGPG